MQKGVRETHIRFLSRPRRLFESHQVPQQQRRLVCGAVESKKSNTAIAPHRASAKLAAFAALVCLLSACGGGSVLSVKLDPAGSQPSQLSASPSNLDFGNIRVGS